MKDIKSRYWWVHTCREGYTIEKRATRETTFLNCGCEGQNNWKALARKKRDSTDAFNAACMKEFYQCKVQGATTQPSKKES